MELTETRKQAIKWIASQIEYATGKELVRLRKALISIANGTIPAWVHEKMTA